MEDMDEARGAEGTVADFSAWNVNNKFGKMKVTSTEKVIEPTSEEQVETKGFVNKSKQRTERLKELEEEQAKLKAEEEAEKKAEEEKRKRPGTNTFNINVNSLNEIKELAKTLLPKINEVKREEYQIACELAINYAMIFEGVWEQQIGGLNVQEKQQ